MGPPPQAAQPLPPLGPPRAAAAVGLRHAGRSPSGGDARLSDRFRARPLVRRRGAAGGAHKWFNQPVVEIKQISAYSCRGMNGQPGAHISEHAFGNALNIAAFVLADGHRITVEGGWKGSPEEQGFLRDVPGSACNQFTTVLAPGSNQYHYNHIHVDLMRRASSRRICQPGAVDGEVVAARARVQPALRIAAGRSQPADAALPDPAGRARQRSVRLARRRPPGMTPARPAGFGARRPGWTPKWKTSTGSRSRAHGPRSTGARTTATRCIERHFPIAAIFRGSAPKPNCFACFAD